MYKVKWETILERNIKLQAWDCYDTSLSEIITVIFKAGKWADTLVSQYS